MKLDVFFGEKNIGALFTTSGRGIAFSYSKDAAKPISISLPDLDKEYPERQCLPFFDGLLPEGYIRRRIADLAHVPYTSTMKLLSHYGEDVAGALSIIPDDEPRRENPGSYVQISEEEIARRVQDKTHTPLLYSGRKTKLSLAGAENKIPVFHQDGRFYLATGSLPTSSIIKASDEFVQNEYLCTKLASLCSLHTSEMVIHDFCGIAALLIKRYDRVVENGTLIRLHQEDFCQALGVMPENKYEENGGPTIEMAVRLIQDYSSNPEADLRQFLMMTVFNYLIGNCDAHGKNFSFLYDANLQSRILAPFYDIVCSSIDARFDRSFAMRLGNDKELSRISRSSFEASAPKRLIDMIMDDMIVRFPKAIEQLRREVSRNLLSLLERIVADSQPRQASLKR